MILLWSTTFFAQLIFFFRSRLVVAILDSFHFEVSCVAVESQSKNGSKNLVNPKFHEESSDLARGIIEEQLQSPKPYDLRHQIYDSITIHFVPELQNCLMKKASVDSAHKLTKKSHYDEDEEILRIPLALALVKLLQKVGGATLEDNLPK